MPRQVIAELLVLLAQFTLIVLVTLRLSWLIIDDMILVGTRTRVEDWLDRNEWEKARWFISCPFCIGFWIGAAVVAAMDIWSPWSFPQVGWWPFAINIVVAPLYFIIDRWIVPSDD